MECSPDRITCQVTKRSLNKLKRIEIISSIFSRPQWYETRNQLQKKNGKEQTCGDKQHATKNALTKPMVNEEIKEEIRKYLETNENGNTLSKIYGMQQKLFRRSL